jgi:hypothetical protein
MEFDKVSEIWGCKDDDYEKYSSLGSDYEKYSSLGSDTM